METVEKINILLVDDNPGKLLAHETVLAGLAENVVEARSGREALELLLKREFAVILLDVNMPEMDGFETAELIRQKPSLERTPIIFLTSYNTTDLDRLKGYDLGAVDYLFLPIVPQVLKAKVQVFVDLARQKQMIRKQADALDRQTRDQEEQIRIIRDLNEKLKNANEELEGFSYTVSHDLRSPLRALEGYSHLLLEEYVGKLGPEAEEYLQRINKAAARMDDLVRDLLAYSRVAHGESRLHTVDLSELLNEIVSHNQRLHDAQTCISINHPLHKVTAHAVGLSQCIANLLENAIKFVAPNTIPKVTIRTEPKDSFVRLWIEDEGIGIDPSFHNRMFRIFERAQESGAYEGTGIGLAIVKKGIERMGGRVGFESQPNQGSKFWIDLPSAANSNRIS
jgi:two-component system sensor histidine kinase/response regulator